MKNLKLAASRMQNTVICFFHIKLTANENGNPEGKIAVINSNAGVSINNIEINIKDIYIHKKGVDNLPDLIAIPASYVELCDFITYN